MVYYYYGEGCSLSSYRPCDMGEIFIKRPLGYMHKYPSFVNKYLGNHDPDTNDRALELGKGEFSVHAEIAFQRHLDKLKTDKPINTNPSKQPGRLINDREALREL